MNAQGETIVLKNRLSWNSFEKIRQSQGLNMKRKQPLNENGGEPPKKRKHGCTSANLDINKEQLLHEARMWQPNQHINWSQLGLQYGLNVPNRGQIIKEYLAEQGIPAAHIKQCTGRAQRRQKKRLPGGKISFPMYLPVRKLKGKVAQRIDSGEICIGKETVTTTESRYTTHECELRQENTEVKARKIPLLEIRKRLLEKQENLGIIRQHPDEYYATLPLANIKAHLSELHETIDPESSEKNLRHV